MDSAQTLIRNARMDCEAVAVGPYVPLVFERYEYIGGERGWRLGYPHETLSGASCIVWTAKAAAAIGAKP